MKTVASIADAHKMALRHGAALEVDGSTFNTGRSRAAHQTPKPQAPPALVLPQVFAPAPPPIEPGMSRAAVESLIAERDRVWQNQIKQLVLVFGESLRAMNPPPEPENKVERFKVTYDAIGRVDVVLPIYAK